jgi:hypothetical protein
VPKRKRNLEGGALLDLSGLELNMTNIKIDEANNMPTWVLVYLNERRLIEEDLFQ